MTSTMSNSTSVCIICTFLDSSATDCVAVVHQRISQLNSSGLMNIESSHKFTRSGDTASGCIDGVNLEDYQVGVVVGGREVKDVPGAQGLLLSLHVHEVIIIINMCTCLLSHIHQFVWDALLGLVSHS